MAKIVRTISRDASVTASAIDSRDIVSEIRRIHNTSPVMTAALGRLATGASLIGYGMKNETDSLTIRINGGGSAGTLITVADSSGNVKAYAENPFVELPLNSKGKLDVGGAVGKNGTLSVIMDLGLKEPYSGQVPLVSGEIAEDIAQYFAVSEQTPTVCGLGVLVDRDLSVKAAGGYLIRLLPFADESVIDVLEKNIKLMPTVTEMLSDGMDPEQMAMRVLEGLEPELLDSTDAFYRCDCSQERVERALVSIGADELEKMAEEQETSEVCCHFCGKKYHFTSDEIRELVKKAK